MSIAVAPRLSSVNLFVRDMGAALAFYRRLGLQIPAGLDQDVHVEVQSGGFRLEFDTQALTRAYDPDWRPATGGNACVLQFLLPSREAIDTLHADLVAAGFRSRLEPFDAFWGARYACVLDPDGNLVGLTSDQDPSRGGPPPDL
jgi:catechol 2,3-dioxygenase-like lactoylglutathione lyase family enzyme